MTTPVEAYGGLPRSPRVVSLRDRHLEFFRGLARRAHDARLGAERDQWATVLGSEMENIRAALGWAVESGTAEIALDLAGSCTGLWQDGHWAEGRWWVGRALAMSDAPTPERVEALSAAAALNRGIAQLEAAEEGLTAARALGDAASTARVLARVGELRYAWGRPEDAVAAYEEAVRLGAGLAPAVSAVAFAQVGLAWDHVEKGDSDGARLLLRHAREALEEPGFEGALAVHLGVHAGLLASIGDLAEAERCWSQKLELEAQPGLSTARADTLLALADVKLAQSCRPEARALWGEVLRLGEASANHGDVLRVEVRLAHLDLKQADLETAAARLARAQRIVDDSDDPMDDYPENLPAILFLRSLLAQHRGDIVEAERLLEARVRGATRPALRSQALLALARLLRRCGDRPRAIALFRDAVDALEEPRWSAVSTAPSLLALAEDDPLRAWDLYEHVDAGASLAGRARVATHRGSLALELKDPDLARDQIDIGLAAARAVGFSEEVELLHQLVQAELLAGDIAAASGALERVFPRWPEVGADPASWVELVETVARVRAADGNHQRGAELLGLADAERERVFYPHDGEPIWRAALVAAAKAVVGDGVFDAAQGRGRAFDIRTELWQEAGR